MPEVKQIDWSKMPQITPQKTGLSKKARRKLSKQKRAGRLKKQPMPRTANIGTKYVFQPVLPNRDRFKLQHELSVLDSEVRRLQVRRTEIIKDIKEIKARDRQGKLQPVSLYALELEDGCYYIGMSFDVARRFKKHYAGKGAQWTKLHKPVSILEERTTEFYDQDEVARLEDDMTLEYALKYGSDKVRGGGYCQAKPRWPAVILENEAVVII